MAEILLFHHARGLTEGVKAFAETLRQAGHTVHAPDLFEGRTFGDTESGVAHVHSIGEAALATKAAAAARDLPDELVYAGMSLGCALATSVLLDRPGARGAFFLYGAVAPSWWEKSWPAGVPAISHQTVDDPWREAGVDELFQREIPGAEIHDYPGAGHLFLDSSTEEYDDAAAELATERILAWLAGLS